MTRNNAREIAVHLVFGLEFGARSAEEVLKSELSRERFEALGQESPLYAQYPNEKQREYIRALVEGVYAHGEELDAYISRYAVGWSLSRIPRMARAILRTAMYEVLYMPDVPNASAIDAAVELTKQYEPQEVASFVNGILGTFVRTELPDEPLGSRRSRRPAGRKSPAGRPEPCRYWGWTPATTPPPPPCLTGRGAGIRDGCWRCVRGSWACARATPSFSM